MTKLNRTLLATLLTTLSVSAFAGHHEEGEKAMDAAKDKGEEMVMEKAEGAKAELEAMRSDVDVDAVKDKIDEAQDAADMSKLQDDAESAVEEMAPE